MKHPSTPTSKDNIVEVSASRGAALLRQFDTLGGNEILERILGERNPRKVVEELPSGDFFWLVKKIGSDESHPLLELATPDQWQYLLDLEIWDRDEINAGETLSWLQRLFEADSRRTVLWLLGEGSHLTYFIFQNSIEVILQEEDEKEQEIPEGFFTHDGVLYLHAHDPEFEPFLRELTGAMAAANLPAYRTLMSGLASVIRSEMEEGMYRMRNRRLAENGFLPFEEAISIYSPLSPEQLNREGKPVVDISPDDENRALVPFLPFYEGTQVGFLQDALEAVRDPVLMDRLRLEFAGIANQIASAEGLARVELDGLVATTRKAAGYLNIALEELTGRDPGRAGALLEKNTLTSLFRAGFAFVLRVKRVAETWLRTAWFRKAGFDKGFWGAERGSMLSGLLLKKPLLYTGLQKGEIYRDFAGADDITDASKALMGLIALDGFMAALAKTTPIGREAIELEDLTCFHLLFTFWARRRLELEPGFAAITPEEARAFFTILRKGEAAPPYQMTRFRDVFLEDMLGLASKLPDDLRAALQEELSKIWEEFVDEYKDVPPEDTDMKHNPFLMIS
ncbi:MAG TPA: DUF6178 family protein [Syntrophales bacterium]|nr:DUF6178 family protein [Syntrophales bacterium]